MPLETLCVISLQYINSNWNYSPETVKLGFDLCELDIWLLILTFCMDITFVNGNNLTMVTKFHGDMMRGT